MKTNKKVNNFKDFAYNDRLKDAYLFYHQEAVDKILGLREKGLRSAVLLPIGYREEEKDWLVNLVKVRKSTEDLVTVIE